MLTLSMASTAGFPIAMNAYVKDISTGKTDCCCEGFLRHRSVAFRSDSCAGESALASSDANGVFVAWLLAAPSRTAPQVELASTV